MNTSTKVITSCFLSGCLEMYDFAIFGLLASIIHEKYFIFMSSNNSLMITYLLFSVGFLFRPLGAIVFGHIGDKYGRKLSLVLSVSMMGTASLSMCFMPSYELIGISSCYLIAFVRIIQGISVGGEFSGGVIYAVEHSNIKRRGLVGSSVVVGSSLGILLATIVAYVVKGASVPEYSWRLAFLLGGGLAIIGFFIRQKLTETPEFINIKKVDNRMPLINGLKKYKLESLSAILIIAAGGSNLYFAVIYLPLYLNGITAGLDLSYLPIITSLCLVLLSSFWGWKSDQIGRDFILLIGAILSGIYVLMMMPLIMSNPTSLSISLIIAVHAILLSIQNGTMNVFAVEIFPTEYRYSCSAFCHSLGMGVIGGTIPIIATLINEHFLNSTFILSLYLCFVTLLAGGAVFLTSVKHKRLKV